MTLAFEQALLCFEPELPLVVAYSGGADSTALLLACAHKWPGQVRAAHVHHGLQAAADGFAEHCQRVCASLDIPLALRRVDARPAPGDSPEDAARRLRYGALTAMAVEDFGATAKARATASIAIAQHADDQAETLLLALSRGAGLAGLAAMPALWQRSHGAATITLHRPLLQVPASDIRTWLAVRAASFIEDPSNTNQALTRNRIRARLLPVLDASFPAFRETFARTAAHAAQAQQLLLEIAVEDLARIGQPPAIDALRALSRARSANLLRHWLRSAHGQSASAAQLDELLDQVAACSTRGHGIAIKVGTGHVRRAGARLDWLPTARAPGS
jgi:tRNA(Ile)-lysidine synthase